MGSGYAYRCEVCDSEPLWTLLRRGDVVISWACAEDLSAVAMNLQRDFEVTELIITHTPKAREWAEIGESLRKIDPTETLRRFDDPA